MNEVKTPKKPLIFYYVMVFLLLMMLNFMAIPWMAERQVREVDYGTFMTMTEDKKIAKVEIDESEIVFTDKDGNIYRQSYKRGKTDDTVKIVGQCDESLHGTKVHFLPDPEIFEETVYDYDTLKQRLRETAFLTKGLKITLKDVRENSHHNHVFHYEGGIKEFVEYLNRGKEALYDEVIYCM